MLQLTLIIIILFKIECSSGTETTYCNLTTPLSESNINDLKDCEHFQGTIFISDRIFKSMSLEDMDVLKSIKTIKGHLKIATYGGFFTSLAFLENLEQIEGMSGNNNEICIVIENTLLKSISLPKLKKINCNVRIEGNTELCYSDQWHHADVMNKQHERGSIIRNNIIDKGNCRCDEQCANDKCWGEGPNQCSDCQNSHLCTSECFDSNGRRKDCNISKTITKTGDSNSTTCNDNEYKRNGECKQCHGQCKNGCNGPGSRYCNNCKHVKDNDRCKASCPINNFSNNGSCETCHVACIDGCTGPQSYYGNGGCNFCNKIIMEKDSIFCLPLQDPCPHGYINSIVNSDVDESLKLFNGHVLCIPQKNIKFIKYILLAVGVAVIISICWIIIILRRCINRTTSIRRETGPTDKQQVSQIKLETTSLLSKLLIIKESEIHKVKILGEGAFGRVYEAIWKLHGTNSKMSVALKLLHENSSSFETNKFLDEAVIMASMDHIHILHLLAVCITTDVMLITKLMPLGSILNYVRDKRRLIQPKALLTWSAQIAKGMAYLESKHLVHRDLAARNVLLESEYCVKITDFGLSKFADTHEILQSETKFPIKWLAPECLEERRFTHKSDVWAFAVTIWELLTFGDEPFKNIKSTILLDQLKKGLRLEQPMSCNADVYVELVRCWIINPEFRPDFEHLETTFKKMSYEASRYLTNYERTPFIKLNSSQEAQPRALSFIYSKNGLLISLPSKSSELSSITPIHSTRNVVESICNYQKNIAMTHPKYDITLKRSLNSKVYEKDGYLKPITQSPNHYSEYGCMVTKIIPRNHSIINHVT